jgi:hypothetical protein
VKIAVLGNHHTRVPPLKPLSGILITPKRRRRHWYPLTENSTPNLKGAGDLNLERIKALRDVVANQMRVRNEDNTVTVTRGLLPRASRNVKCIYDNALAHPLSSMLSVARWSIAVFDLL